MRARPFSLQVKPALLFKLSAVLMMAQFLVSPSTLAKDSSKGELEAFFKTHCLRCHNSEKRKGRFRLDNLSRDFDDPQVAEKWGEVVFRINAGEMPPPKEPQPSAAEIRTAVEILTKKIREGSRARMAKRGLVEHYRLSRQEYAHTVYDLLGVVFDVEAPGAFNEDPRLHGFDRIGSLLATAPAHIERYFDAANTIIKLAFDDHNPPSRIDRIEAGKNKRRLLQLGEIWNFARLRTPGHYRFKIKVSGLPAFTGRVPRLSLWHNHHKKSFAGIDLKTSEDKPETIVFEGLFPAGGYAIRNHARSQNHPNGAYKLYRNELIDADQSIATYKGGFNSFRTKVVDEQGRPVMPLLLIDWVEVEGPLTPEDVMAKRKLAVPLDVEDPKEMLKALKRFSERAWRRPVSEAELKPYLQFIAKEQETGESFPNAYRSALTAMLVTRSFFNLEEGSPDFNRLKVHDFELASRLSYFLWSSMPDEKLFDIARTGNLNKSQVLTAELDRMMSDSKIERFLHSFPKQWLQLHRVGMFQPDPRLYPKYDPWLEESMVMETTAYFREMFKKDLPLSELVDSNWTMLNSRLALHYRLPVPKEAKLSRVELSPDSHRGGILTQGSILSLTSDGTRHRPVHRGAWVLEAIFARTPSPPPPNVDPLEPVKGNQPKTTIRSQLEAHATDPNCVSCHAKIDPLGLAFENFDAIGRWRTRERVEGGVGENPKVDASGVFLDGRTFKGPKEFKKLLAEDDDRLAEAFLEQLATYALRRVMTVDDIHELHEIAKSQKENRYRLRSLIRAFVLSDLFQRR